VKPAPFAYHAPSTIEEAAGLLASHAEARLLAGGQSLVPMMNFRVATPDHLIDLNRNPALSEIVVTGDRITIGAMARQRTLERSTILRERLPVLAEALAEVGHLPTRNRGTIGGSLCHLDPAAELPAVMLAFDAVLTARSTSGVRHIPMAAFAVHVLTTALRRDEILTHIEITPWAPGHGFAFIEAARRHGDFALVSACALIETDEGGAIRRCALVLGGMGPVAQRCGSAEALLLGQEPAAALFDVAAAETTRLEVMEDLHADAWYRRRIAAVMTRRALVLAASRCRRIAR
jgi:carbon-monoxide dehydrogenase medium subunit